MSLGMLDAMKRRFGWLTIPFIYGDINITDKDTDTDPSQDSDQECSRSNSVYNGTVASFNFFFLMTCSLFAVGMMPVMESKLNKNVILENVPVEIILIIFMIAGVSVKLLFVIFRDRVSMKQGSKLFNGVDRIMYVIGLVIFYLSGCISDIFHVTAKVTCDQIWRSCDDKIFKAYAIDVMFYLTKIIYLGGSVLFTLVFYSSRFVNTCLVRYGLMFLLSTHLAIWFDLFVHQSQHLLRTKEEEMHLTNLTNYCNVSEFLSNVTLQWKCTNHATPAFKLLRNKIVRICYPFAFQGFILITERFLHWIPGSHSEDTSVVRMSLKKRNRNGGAHSLNVNLVTDVRGNVVVNNDDADSDSESGNEATIPEETERPDDEVADNRRVHLVYWALVIVVTIIINVPILLSRVVTSNETFSPEHIPAIIHDKYVGYTIVFCLFLMICGITAGYGSAASFRIIQSKPFTKLNYLVVLSLIGNFGLSVCFLTLLHTSPHEAVSKFKVTVVELVIIFECYYQLPFCLFAIRVVVHRAAGSLHRRAMLFKAVLIHLAVSNAMLWVANIFVVVFRSDWSVLLPIEKPKWRFVVRLLLSMNLFYRFGCLLLLAKALRKTFSAVRIKRHNNFVDMPQ